MSKITAERKAEADLLKRFYQAAKARQPQLRQRHIAQELGVTAGSVAGWLNGHARCPDQALIRVAELLDFDPTVVRPEVHARLIDKSDRAQKIADITRRLEAMDSSRISEISRYIAFIMSTRQ